MHVHGQRIRQRMYEQCGTATASELASSRKDDEGGDQDEDGEGTFSRAPAMSCSRRASRYLHLSSSRRLHARWNQTTALPSQRSCCPSSTMMQAKASTQNRKTRIWTCGATSVPRTSWPAMANANENRGTPQSMAPLAAEAEVQSKPSEMQCEKSPCRTNVIRSAGKREPPGMVKYGNVASSVVFKMTVSPEEFTWPAGYNSVTTCHFRKLSQRVPSPEAAFHATLNAPCTRIKQCPNISKGQTTHILAVTSAFPAVI